MPIKNLCSKEELICVNSGLTQKDFKVCFALSVTPEHKKTRCIRRSTWKVILKPPNAEVGVKGCQGLYWHVYRRTAVKFLGLAHAGQANGRKI